MKISVLLSTFVVVCAGTYLVVVNHFPNLIQKTIWQGDAGVTVSNYPGIVSLVVAIILVSVLVSFLIQHLFWPREPFSSRNH